MAVVNLWQYENEQIKGLLAITLRSVQAQEYLPENRKRKGSELNLPCLQGLIYTSYRCIRSPGVLAEGLSVLQQPTGELLSPTGKALPLVDFADRHTPKGGAQESEEIKIPFDLVIAANGMKEENKLAKKIMKEFPEAYMIGDAVKYKQIGDAVHQGFFTGLRI